LELPLLSFTAEVLAHLPYSTATDPLFIIYHIQTLGALQGAQLLDRIAAFLQGQGVDGVDANDANVEEDVLEIAAKKKNPSRSNECAAVGGERFDLLRFLDYCVEASSFVLMFRLKKYLRDIYNLSETRCLTFTPESQENNFDKITTPPVAGVFDSSLENFFKNGTDGSRDREEIDQDALIRLYAEFRMFVRIEQTAETRASDSEEEDTAPSRKRKLSEL